MTASLPTQQQIITNVLEQLDVARGGLSEARDWLISDARDNDSLPDGVHPTVREARTAVGAAKDEIDQAKSALYRVLRLLNGETE